MHKSLFNNHPFTTKTRIPLIEQIIFSLCLLITVSTDNRQFSQFIDTSTLTCTQVTGAEVTNSGTIAYIAMFDTDGQSKIKKYDLTSGALSLLGEYSASGVNNIRMEEFYFIGEYLIGHYEGLQTYNIFNESSFAFVAEHSVTGYQFKELFYSAFSLNVIFWTSDGKVGLIAEANFPYTSAVDLLELGTSGQNVTSVALSTTGQFLAFSQNTIQSVYVYNLNNNSLIFNPHSTKVDRIEKLEWSINSNVLFMYFSNVGMILKKSMGNNGVTGSSSATQIMDRTVYDNLGMFYFEEASYNDHMISISVESDNVPLNYSAIFMQHYDISTQAVETYQWELEAQMKGFKFSDDHIGYMTVWLIDKVYLLRISGCDVGVTQYYKNSTLECIDCTDACANCSEEGCYVEPVENETTTTNDTIEAEQQEEEVVQNDTPSQFVATQATQETFQTYSLVLDSTMGSDSFAMMNKVPHSRRIFSVFFSFFVNFDDIWLYSYHQRQYDIVISKLLELIQTLQEEKWAIIPCYQLWNLFGVDLSQLKSLLQHKKQWTSGKFYEVEGSSNGFIANTMNFTFSNLFFNMVIFLVLRFLFYRLFDYKISILLRPYSFWPYFLLTTTDGNLQYFVYLLNFELYTMWSRNIWSKLMYVFILVVLLLLVLIMVCLFFFLKQRYGNLSKYFLDNFKNNSVTVWFLTLNFGIRSLIFGSAHFVYEDCYYSKLILLTCLEMGFLAANLFIIRLNEQRRTKQKNSKPKDSTSQLSLQKTRSPIFLSKFKLMMGGILSVCIRILLNLTLMLSYDFMSRETQQQQVLNIFIFTHIVLVYVYMFCYNCSILYGIGEGLVEMYRIFCSEKSEEIAQNLKEINMEIIRQEPVYPYEWLKPKKCVVQNMWDWQEAVNQQLITNINLNKQRTVQKVLKKKARVMKLYNEAMKESRQQKESGKGNHNKQIEKNVIFCPQNSFDDDNDESGEYTFRKKEDVKKTTSFTPKYDNKVRKNYNATFR